MDYLLNGIETERLRFRAIDQQKDFNLWLPFFQSHEAMKHWPMGNLSPMEYAKQWYAKQANRYQNNWGGLNTLIEKDSGRLVGHAGLLTQKIEGKIELEVAYSLLPEHWKKGYATEAAQFCVNYAFKKRLCSSLVSIISTSNEPSIAVAKRIGMQWEQKIIFQQVEAHLYRIRNKHLSK